MDEKESRVIRDNVLPVTAGRIRLLEKELAHIGDMALQLFDTAGDEVIFFRDGEFAELYAELTASETPECAEINRLRVEKIENGLLPYKKALLCRRFCDLLGLCSMKDAETFFDDEGNPGDDTMSYFRGAYADEAFSRFAEKLGDPRVMYASSFAEACENVYHGRCGCCIIPIENSTDGRLSSFRSTVSKYGLKTVMTCKVTTSEFGDYTVFALLRSSLSIPENAGHCYLDVRIDSACLKDVLSAADVGDMEAVSVNSSPEGGYDITFGSDGNGICGFLAYMLLEKKDFGVNGIYCAV